MQGQPSLFSNDYDQNELKFKADWLYSGASRFQFLGGPVSRKHKDFNQRDFSGVNARVVANLQPTGKTSVQAQVFRELSGISDLTVSYAVVEGYAVNAGVNVSPKVSINADVRRQTLDYKGAEGIPGVVDNARRDAIRSHSLDLTYRATSHMAVAFSLFERSRSSNQALIGFTSRGGFVSAKYDF